MRFYLKIYIFCHFIGRFNGQAIILYRLERATNIHQLICILITIHRVLCCFASPPTTREIFCIGNETAARLFISICFPSHACKYDVVDMLWAIGNIHH